MQNYSNRRIYSKVLLRPCVSTTETAEGTDSLLGRDFFHPAPNLRHSYADPRILIHLVRKGGNFIKNSHTYPARALASSTRSSTEAGISPMRSSRRKRGSKPCLFASWMLKPGLALISNIRGPKSRSRTMSTPI